MVDWKVKVRALINQKFGTRQDKYFAEQIGLEANTLSHKLNGRRGSSLEDIELIANGLDVPVEELLVDTGRFILLDRKKVEALDLMGVINLIEKECKSN